MGINQSGTFIYSPDITAVISTQSPAGIIDVSADIIDFTLDRQINAVSSFSCTLNNPNRKYNFGNSHAISTMDRITVFLKRTTFVQCFTGYVTYAPIETLVPTPVTIQASCTLRILQVTYWDDTLLTFQTMLLNMFAQTLDAQSASTVGDGGIAQAVVNMLNGVCGWSPDKIHIQGIPANFINFAADAYTNLITQSKLDQNAVAELSKLLSIGGITSGQSVTTGPAVFQGTTTLTNTDAPDNNVGTTIKVSEAHAFGTTPIGTGQANFPGPHPLNPVSLDKINEDIFYCSAPFSYLQYQITNNLSAAQKKKYNGIINRAKSWLSHNRVKNSYDGRLLVLANQRTNRVVAVRATSIPQKANTPAVKGHAVYDNTIDYLQCHPGVIAYLNGSTKDPKTYTGTGDTGYSYITASWADQTKVHVGVQKDLNTSSASSLVGNGVTSPGWDPLIITQVTNTLMKNLRGQIGDAYTQNSNPKKNHGLTRITPGTPGRGNGSFDCSGLARWGYETIGIRLPNYLIDKNGNKHYNKSDSVNECGPTNGHHPEIYGQWISSSQKPQVGDLLFWEVPSDSGDSPQHVCILSKDFNAQGVGAVIQASEPGVPLGESPIYWNQIKNGQLQNWGKQYNTQTKKYHGPGAKYIGARRPLTLHPHWTSSQLIAINNTSTAVDNIVAPGTSIGTNATTSGGVNTQTLFGGDPQQTSITSLTNAYSNLMQSPQYDIRATMMVGTPRAFLLDNPVMQDLTQILQGGLRSYMSAPNGDFVAWFPDYYGVYGTDPVLDISPVEIIDFQIYHDDNQLTTHVGIIGDTTGIGAQVSSVDYINTNGIVSIQDGTTMQLLFGTQGSTSKAETQNSINALNFLNRYGMRPYVQEQSMIHVHSLEYFYALYTFMNQWANQFATNITLSFMPELYPGMRISMSVEDETGTTNTYQFYANSVTHQGSRAGGFTTQVALTAPMKNGKIMHYGLDLA